VKKGKLRFYPYNINWNYGLLPQNWEDPAHKAEDVGGVAARPRARARSARLCPPGRRPNENNTNTHIARQTGPVAGPLVRHLQC